jgi:hypothetical protein
MWIWFSSIPYILWHFSYQNLTIRSPSLSLCLSLSLCRAMLWTQSLTLARKALFHLSYTTSFWFACFPHKVLSFCWDNSLTTIFQYSYLCLPCCLSYRCEPPCLIYLFIYFLSWPWTVILLIFATGVSGITDVHHCTQPRPPSLAFGKFYW